MTRLLSLTARPGAPVACDLSDASDSLADRLAEYRLLFEDALVGRETTATTTTYRFAARPDVAERVRDLAMREAGCCGFLSFEIDDDGDEIVWTTTAGADATGLAVLDELFHAATAYPQTSEEVAERLRERGLPVIGVGD
jgi:hypothetical protein